MTEFPQPSSGMIDGRIHRYALRVFYEDTDAGGVVYHANYLRWFERARTDLLLLLGVGTLQGFKPLERCVDGLVVGDRLLLTEAGQVNAEIIVQSPLICRVLHGAAQNGRR